MEEDYKFSKEDDSLKKLNEQQTTYKIDLEGQREREEESENEKHPQNLRQKLMTGLNHYMTA